MVTYIIRRILLMIPTLIGMTAVVFFTMALTPGGIGGSLLRGEMGMRPGEREARREYLNRQYGLDYPSYIQYGHWLNKISPIGFTTYADDVPQMRTVDGKPEPVLVKKGDKMAPALAHRIGDIRWGWPVLKSPDLGRSFEYNRQASSMIAERLPVTLTLNFVSIPVIYSIGILSGIYAGRFRGRFFDVGLGSMLIVLWSLPAIWIGVLLLGFFASREHFYWFDAGGLHNPESDTMSFLPSGSLHGPGKGWLLDTLYHLVLPVICLSYGGFAYISKLTRSSLLENLSADFIRTARAKGVADRDVLFRHAFRNSLIPLITISAAILPGLLAGSVVVEYIFTLPGMGTLFIDAAKTKDPEVVLSIALVEGLLGLIAYLIADIGYAIADPRVTYE